MKYLLDTNILSEAIVKRNGKILRKLRRLKKGSVVTSVIVASEIEFGLQKKPHPVIAELANRFLNTITILPLHPGIAAIYGKIRAELEKAGTPIGPNDLFIAAHALQQKLILVTRNEEEFKRVPGLKIENWFA